MLGLASVVAVVAVGAAYDLARIYRDVRTGQDVLTDLELSSVQAEGGVESTVASAAGPLDRAAARAASSPFLKVVGAAPLADDQVDALRELTELAATLGDLGRDAGEAVQAELDRPQRGPEGRIDLLDTVLEELDGVRRGLDDIELAAGDSLLPPLASARDQVVDRLDQVDEELDDGQDMVAALRALLVGPSDLLILGANNAEMTAGSGMPLSAGIARLDDGDIDVGEFTPTSELNIAPDGVDLPGDLANLYHPMGLGTDFRGTTATPNFPVTGSLLAEMAARSPLGPVDGVLVVDAYALRALIEATGPVRVDGVAYTSGNVVEQILHENYLRFGSRTDREQRTDLQSEIAREVFDAFKTRDLPITDLAAGLTEAAKGRHLLAWSPDEDLQGLWEAVGADGGVGPSGLAISVENYDGNKLDWFIAPTAALNLARASDGSWQARLAVTVANPELVPEESSPQVVGRDPDNHFVFLDLHLPGSAYDVRALNQPFEAQGRDGPMRVATMIYPIERGTSRTVNVSFSLPGQVQALNLLPGARVHPLRLDVNGSSLTDAVAAPFPLAPREPGVLSLFRTELAGFGALLALAAAVLALSTYRTQLSGVGGRLAPSRLSARASVGLSGGLAVAGLLFAALSQGA